MQVMTSQPTMGRLLVGAVSIFTLIFGTAFADQHTKSATTQTATATITCSYGTLELSSAQGGVSVIESSSSSSWGVETGDLITNVDRTSVAVPEDIFSIIRALIDSSIPAVVERAGSQQTVSLNVKIYQACMPPPPPPPPPPPA